MAEDPRAWRQAVTVGGGTAGHDKCGRAVRDRRGVCRRYRSVLGKGRFQVRNFFRPRLAGLFVGIDQGLALARRHGDRRDLGGKGIVGLRGLGALERPQRELVLRRTRELVARGAILGKASHQPAAIIGILEPVEKHVVLHGLVAETGSASHGRRQVGRVCHALHAARDDRPGAAGTHKVVRHHHGLHARSADLVEGRGRHILAKPGGKAGLACRCLADARRQHAAHDHLVDRRRIDARIPDRAGNGAAAEFRRGKRRQFSLERPHRRARGTGNDYLCGLVGHPVSPLASRHGVSWFTRGASYGARRRFSNLCSMAEKSRPAPSSSSTNRA